MSPTDTHLVAGAYADRDPVKFPPWVRAWTPPAWWSRSATVSSTCRRGTSRWHRPPDGAHGGYREDLVLRRGSVVRAPAGVDAVAASTLPMNGLTARLALDQMALEPGQVLAVTGAAGAFGGYVVQLAKADGLTVVADASPADEQLVRELGADVVVRRGDDVAARIREHFPDGVHGLADGSVQDALFLPAVQGRRRGGHGARLSRRRAARAAGAADEGAAGGGGPCGPRPPPAAGRGRRPHPPRRRDLPGGGGCRVAPDARTGWGPRPAGAYLLTAVPRHRSGALPRHGGVPVLDVRQTRRRGGARPDPSTSC